MNVENGTLLDNTGWRILEELQQNARLTYKELGRRVNLSAPATAERMRRMEEAGIITGYRAEVNAEKVGLPLTAFVRIEVPGVNHQKVEALVTELPEVLECHRATGTDCFLMKTVLASTDHLRAVLDKLVVWGNPVTSIVISPLFRGEGSHVYKIPPREIRAGQSVQAAALHHLPRFHHNRSSQHRALGPKPSARRAISLSANKEPTS
jgi:Lrp/AsnC family leucine-responsive transcriptional regulator